MMQFTLDKIKYTFIRVLSGINFLFGQSIIQDYGSCVHVRTQVALANAEYQRVSELIDIRLLSNAEEQILTSQNMHQYDRRSLNTKCRLE